MHVAIRTRTQARADVFANKQVQDQIDAMLPGSRDEQGTRSRSLHALDNILVPHPGPSPPMNGYTTLLYVRKMLVTFKLKNYMVLPILHITAYT